MKKGQKRKLQQCVQNDSLVFQTLFGAKKKFQPLTQEIDTKQHKEQHVLEHLGVANDMEIKRLDGKMREQIYETMHKLYASKQND